jgi:hypothetical protein
MRREIAELREVVQKLVPLLAGKGLKVTQRGSQAYVKTDPVTRKPVMVNIPNIPDTASDSFIRAVQGFIDHEVAHVLITDWNFYAGAPTPSELRKPEVQKLMNCHNIIEDTMIEREIVKIFPGSKKNIADLREHFIRKVTKPAMLKARSPQEELSYLMVPAMRALAGHVEFQEFMDENNYWDHSEIKKLVEGFRSETLEDLKTCATTEQTLEIARELYDILYKPKPEEPEQEPESGPSQDKPEKEAGEGDGDGERDHSKQEESDDEGSEGDDGKAAAPEQDEGDQKDDDGEEAQSGGDADDEQEKEDGDDGDQSDGSSEKEDGEGDDDSDTSDDGS